MRERVKIGVLCLARRTFDFEAAKKIYAKKKAILRALPDVDWIFCDGLIIEVEEAVAAAEQIRRAGVDGVVIISGTFHLGHLALIVNERVKQPLLLWALPELPYDGGKIRLNSLCGLNLNASNLYKSGCDNYAYCFGEKIDRVWIDAVRMKRVLGGARIGIVGYRADGFFNLSVNDLQIYRNFGILIDHYELAEAMGSRGKSSIQEEVRSIFDCSAVTEKQLEKVCAAAFSIKMLMEKNRLDALALRCWPEFADEFGISPCASMSYLASKGYIISCEGDVEGALSMLAARAASGETPFLADISQADLEKDDALLWHCGVASPTLWDGQSEIALDTYFAGGRGVTADFVAQSGRVTVLRLDSARGRTRLFTASGEALPMKKKLKGTYAKVRFDGGVDNLLDLIIQNGVAHHVAMVYGDYGEVFQEFARLCGFEIIKGKGGFDG
jgi:L-fucose isomerase-like protein